MKRYLPFIIIAAVLLAAIGVATFMLRSPVPEKSAQQPSPTAATTTSSSSAPTYAGAPGAEPPHVRSAGEKAGGAATPTSVVTLEEFGDFQCPPCGLLYAELKKIESDYGSRLRVIFRERPLVAIHKNAFDAARAAEAAGLQGRFWEMHDKLYENQAAWSNAAPARPIFISYARSLGLDVERFTRDIDGQLANSRILIDLKHGDSLGVKGTPTLFINDREVKPADMTQEALRATIDAALDGSGANGSK
ncbi:MAG: DsbA family protein [Pyrinomonadaceae bacterium]